MRLKHANISLMLAILFLSCTGVACALPDIVVNSITAPSAMIASEPFDISFRVENIGATAVSGGFYSQMYIDGTAQSIDGWATINLPSGENKLLRKTGVTLSAGTHTVRVVADFKKQVTESNEGNNEKTISINVVAPPSNNYDLYVKEITFPAGMCDGEQFNIDYVVKNLGPDAITGSFSTKMYIDGSDVTGNVPRTGIAAGAERAFTKYSVSLSQGTHNIKVVTDSQYEVTETNENNNELTKSLSVCAPPDPCAGISCYDTCVGTTLNHSGYCSGGICYYQQTPMSTSCGYDPCASKPCPDYCDGTTLFRKNGCSAGNCIYTQTNNSAECGYVEDENITCANYCSGTTLYHDGLVSGGTCNYQVEHNSAECGYVEPVNITCTNHCSGTTWYHDGVVSGDTCIYQSEPDATECGYVEPVNITCTNHCVGTTWYHDGVVSGGTCNYQSVPNSTECGYVEPVVNPCDGVVCPDKCVGTTRNYAGHCSQGVCQYSLEPLSTSCGYDPCAFMLCSDYCNSTTKYSSGSCFAGKCSYSTVQQKSPACGWANNTNTLADIKISRVYTSPRTIACNATRSINAILDLSNQNSNFASNIGVQYSSPELGIVFSALEFNMFGNSVWTKSEPFVMPMNVKPGTYMINISVTYAGTRQNTNAYLTLEPCTDYHIKNINTIPDLYQQDPYLGLPPGVQGIGGEFHCGPTSATNVIVWLYEHGFSNLSDGTQTAALKFVVNNLSSSDYMRTNLNGATNPAELITGLVAYLKDRGYNITGMQFQGWKDVEDKYDTNVTVPSLDWIKEGISEYSGTLLHLGRYYYNSTTDTYTRKTGHWVTAVGYGVDNQSNRDPNIIIIHDPITNYWRGKNDYVNMTLIESGHFTGWTGIPHSAVGYYIMDGAYLGQYDYAILEGAVRFTVINNTRSSISTISTSTQSTTSTQSSTSSSGGSGGSHSSAITRTASSVSPVVTAQAVQPINPAISSLTPRTGRTMTTQNTATATSTVTPATTLTKTQALPASNTSQPTIKKIPLATIGTDCSKNNDCASGEECLPKSAVIRLFMTPKCCPASSDFVDGKCIPPKIAGWNEPCSGAVSCRTGLKCKSTASWWSIFNRDSGVCCYADEKQTNGHCLSKTLRSRPVSW